MRFKKELLETRELTLQAQGKRDLPGAEAFEPFYYGDPLWETITTHNVEFRGIGHLR